MDWTAFSLSLQLAAWTVALLLPIAILIARLLAWGRFRFKSVIEALIMLPLVLPPTVLGFYLLIAFSPQSTFGSFLKSIFGGPLAFTFAAKRKQYGEIIDCSPSRFLDELPPDDLAWEGNDDTPTEVKAVRGNTALADIRAMLKR